MIKILILWRCNNLNIIAFFTLLITGFTSCAEFASYALIHPIIRSLPQEYHIRFEQGLLRTYGFIMPILMPVCIILTVVFAIQTHAIEGFERTIRWSSSVMFIMATISTIIFNVPINNETKTWKADNPPSVWKEKRKRWMFFQAIRSWLLLIAFVLLCFSITNN